MKKRRWLRILLIATGVALFTAYFAFSTFLFHPMEGDYEGELAALIPRNVDFYLSKAGLARDFARFPPEAGEGGLLRSLSASDALAASGGVQALLASPAWMQLERDPELQRALAELDASLAQLPVQVDLLSVYGGEDLAIAGYLRPPGAPANGATAPANGAAAPANGGSGIAWAAYGRASWMGKLGLALLGYPGLIGLEAQGLQAVEQDGLVRLSGARLPATLHLARINDVIVIGNDEALVRAAPDLERRKGQDSFGQSARYADDIQRGAGGERPIEAFADVRKLAERSVGTRPWPDPGQQDPVGAMAGRLFQAALLKDVAGTVDLEGGLALDLHADLASEKMSGPMKRLYRARGFDRDELYQAARYAPADSVLFAYVHADWGALLGSLLESVEPAARTNFNDLVRSVWGHPDASKLLDDVDVALRGRAALVVRVHDYPDEGEKGPPHGDQPVFAWALVCWMESPEKVVELRRKVDGNPGAFGVQGREPGSSGVWTNKVEGGFEVYEYWSAFVPGTGHIACVTADQIFVLSNHHKMIGQMLKTFYGDDGERYAKLADRAEFVALAESGLSYANLALWLDPRPAAATLRRQAQVQARYDLNIDWNVERPRLQKLVLKRDFAGRATEALSEAERASFDSLVTEESVRFQQEYEEQHLPGLLAGYERRIAGVEMVSAALVELALDEKKLDLSLRAVVPLDR